MRAEPVIESRRIDIDAEGARLVGRYVPPVGSARAHLVVHGATGVPQRYYAAFAEWAARQGIGTLTYDYRDFGESLQGSTRDSRATFADWIVRDQLAADRALAQLAPKGPLWVLGHSAGGLGIPFRTFDARVEKITSIGAGFAHYTDHPLSYLPVVLAFWFLVGPVGTTAAGYLPGRRLMLGADLPAGVYWQWRKWCTSRDFFASDIGHSLPAPDFAATGPHLRVLTMSDDVVVPPVAVARFANSFANNRANVQVIKPADYGLTSLRHIEVFSKRNAPAWPAIVGLPA